MEDKIMMRQIMVMLQEILGLRSSDSPIKIALNSTYKREWRETIGVEKEESCFSTISMLPKGGVFEVKHTLYQSGILHQENFWLAYYSPISRDSFWIMEIGGGYRDCLFDLTGKVLYLEKFNKPSTTKVECYNQI